MLTLFALIVVLSVLIFVHELGHLLAAKAVDIEVPRFSIGFGPRVAGFRIGETEYVLSALPLGGYVKMAGMADEEATAVLEGPGEGGRESSGRDFDSKPLWARMMVISAGVIMNFLLALVIYAGLAFFYGERLDATTQVAIPEEAELTGAAAPLREVPFGAEIVAVGDRPVETFTEMQRLLLESPSGPVTLHFADAPSVTLQLPSGDAERVALVRAIQPLDEPLVGQVQRGSPAARAGLQPGDRVVSAAGEPIRTWQQFRHIISGYPGLPLELQIERGGQLLQLSVTPRVDSEIGADGQRVQVGRLGVTREADFIHRTFGPGEALVHGADQTWRYTTLIVGFLGRLITGQESMRNLGGPIAIGQYSGEAARLGLEPFLAFMAIFSINLAVLNLLPIPILDGGQLLFLGLEALRGRPLSLEQRLRLSHVGLIIVVGLMVWAMTNDVLRLLGI